MKTGTIYHIFFSIFGGFISYWLGGYDLILKTLFGLTILDFLTGCGQAIYNGCFSPKKCAKGVIKKIFIYLTVALSVIIQYFVGEQIPIRDTVIISYIIYEGMSNLESIGKVIEYPAKLKDVFTSLNDRV